MNDVSTLWDEDADITDLTDRDLEAARNEYTKVSDRDGQVTAAIERLGEQWDLDASATLDRVVRIELAHAIEHGMVSFTHEDYDVAYTIPPCAWIRQHIGSPTPDSGPPASVAQTIVEADSTVEDRKTIGFSMPVAVEAMLREAIAEGAYESIAHLARTGLARCLRAFDV